MLAADLPDTAALLDLIDARSEPSVTIVSPSSPIPTEHKRMRLHLRDGIDEAERALTDAGVSPQARAEVVAPLRDLLSDDEFWTHQSRSIVVFASRERVSAFRLPSTFAANVSIGDRFDVGALLRAITFPRHAFVLQLSRSGARLSEVGPDHGVIEHPLELPDDLHSVLEHAENHGQSDYPRPQGSTGDRIELDRFSRIVQDAVAAIAPIHTPLVLIAARDLEPSYRDVSTHPHLISRGASAHPDSFTDADLETAVRDVLDEREEAELSQWRERFGTLRAQQLATSKLKEVAVAASTGAVQELLFDMDAHTEGTIDDTGHVAQAEEAGYATYAIVDEIAARVMRSGGTARAVRNADLLDGSPVAAVLRFPLPESIA